MSWFLLALLGHLANGVAFVIDKILLRSAFSRSATYAGVVGLLSAFALVAIPFIHMWPQGSVWLLAIASGASFVFALWCFFAALARAEASRIVPIVGSLIPILTLVGSYIFLGERLSNANFIGFALLILATVILSGGGEGKPSSEAIWLAVTAAFLFAASSVTGKSTYDAAGFAGGFVASRIAAAVASLLILVLLDRRAGREALSMIRPEKKTSATKSKRVSKQSAVLALVGQTLGAIGFLGVQWATAEGSASIVNAMQAVQYALLVLIALVLHKRAPQLLGEKLTKGDIALKVSALAITALGMYFVVA